jgi:hypothetical protein
MSQNLRNCIRELELVSKLKDGRTRRTVLSQLAKKKCIYLALREIALNIVKKNIKLPSKQLRTFLKHEKLIKALARGKGGVHLKKRAVMQSGGFISTILPLLLPILSSIAAPLLSNG